MQSYYEIIGCDKNASHEEIKRCYYKQAKRLHPDKAGENSQEKFRLLEEAWRTLQNPEKRREYDLEMSKSDLDETPLYCELSIKDMSYEPETGEYSYACRCGGFYVLKENIATDCETMKICCDECSFHIVIKIPT